MEKEVGVDREKMLDNMTVWLQNDSMTAWLRNDKPVQNISCTWNRVRWKSMVANAMKHGTE